MGQIRSFYATAESDHEVNIQDWRLVVMDVSAAHSSANAPNGYQVNWFKVMRPQINRSLTASVTSSLSSQGHHVKALWQAFKGNQGFGLYQFVMNGTTYVTTVQGQKEPQGYWTIVGGLQLGTDFTPKAKLEPFDTTNWGGSEVDQPGSYLATAGIDTDKEAVRVRIKFSDGVTKTVPVQNGVFGVLRTFTSKKDDEISLVSSDALNKNGKTLESMTLHAVK